MWCGRINGERIRRESLIASGWHRIREKKPMKCTHGWQDGGSKGVKGSILSGQRVWLALRHHSVVRVKVVGLSKHPYEGMCHVPNPPRNGERPRARTDSGPPTVTRRHAHSPPSQ